ncbi:hypothetical protein OROHE_025417 [Orobanche hederae]
MGVESEANGGGSSGLTRRRGCTCTKDDFRIVQELGQLRQRIETDSCSAGGPGSDPIDCGCGAGGENAQPARDEEDTHVVGPDVVRHGRSHRRRDICFG